MRRSPSLRQLMSGINTGRQRLAQQFGTMEGWQSQQSPRFDEYVKEKRQKQYYDAFDQRVERAFNAAAKAHKTEILNAFKRRLKTSDTKFTAATTLEMRKAVEERLRWLRDVWSQIDADYRSEDADRQAAAAEEITAALRGEPGDYMKWVYELKHEARFMGEKQKAALHSELDSGELPDISEEEATRYHELRLNMSEVERQVKSKYGIAGFQHWSELQTAKDADYEEKLDTAAAVYHELLAQSDRYDESRRTALLRQNVARVHEAQIRFKAAMQLEEEREKMMEAHQSMTEARRAEQKAQRVELLREAAELKASGATSEEVQQAMRQRQVEAHARRQAEYQLNERETVQRKQADYLEALEKFKLSVEEREGRELLRGSSALAEGDAFAEMDTLTPQRSRQPLRDGRPSVNVFGFADADEMHEAVPESDALASTEARAGPARGSPYAREDLTSVDTTTRHQLKAEAPETSTDPADKAALWRAIAGDTYEDPAHAVHQARLDAGKAYDPLYANFFLPSLVQGKKYQRQNLGEHAAGNAMDSQVLKGANRISASYQWGVSHTVVHDIDPDGDTDYFYNGAWHVRDKETRDIDWRYEKKKGGPVFRGPRFYRMGIAREKADGGEQSMDPHPPTEAEMLARRGAASGRAQQRLGQGYQPASPSSSPSSSPRSRSPPRGERPPVNDRSSGRAAATAAASSSVPSLGDWRSS